MRHGGFYGGLGTCNGGFDSLAATTDFFILLISYLSCPVVRRGKFFYPKTKTQDI